MPEVRIFLQYGNPPNQQNVRIRQIVFFAFPLGKNRVLINIFSYQWVWGLVFCTRKSKKKLRGLGVTSKLERLVVFALFFGRFCVSLTFQPFFQVADPQKCTRKTINQLHIKKISTRRPNPMFKTAKIGRFCVFLVVFAFFLNFYQFLQVYDPPEMYQDDYKSIYIKKSAREGLILCSKLQRLVVFALFFVVSAFPSLFSHFFRYLTPSWGHGNVPGRL